MKFLIRNYFWFLLAGLALLEGGYFLYLGQSNGEGGEEEQRKVEIIQPIFGEIPASIKAIPQPDLDREIKAPERYPEFYRKSMEEKIAAAKNMLRQRPYDFYQWSQLAILTENFDDYEGALELWKYLVLVDPQSAVYYGNVAELYHFSIKNYPKAESAYRQAIKNDPSRIDLYRGLHELYRYLYQKDTAASVDILKEGLSKNPGNLTLLVLLATDYRDRGDRKNARAYYTEAIAAARRAGDYLLADQLRRDLESVE